MCEASGKGESGTVGTGRKIATAKRDRGAGQGYESYCPGPCQHHHRAHALKKPSSSLESPPFSVVADSVPGVCRERHLKVWYTPSTSSTLSAACLAPSLLGRLSTDHVHWSPSKSGRPESLAGSPNWHVTFWGSSGSEHWLQGCGEGGRRKQKSRGKGEEGGGSDWAWNSVARGNSIAF